jgi:hypothetical protein
MSNLCSGSTSEKIRELNDTLRRTFMGGQIMLSSGVAALGDETKTKVLTAFREFDAFNDKNNPHGEHDLCNFEIDGHRILAQCDYYDTDMRYLSDDPSNSRITKRVWTLCISEEY